MSDLAPANQLLASVIPFAFLSEEQRGRLAARMTARDLEPAEVVLAAGAAAGEVLFLESGVLEAVEGAGKVQSLVTAGQFYGEMDPLVESRRTVSIRSRERSRVWILEGQTFLDLVEEDPTFALALAIQLRDKHGIFAKYQHFYARVLGLLDRRSFLLLELLDAYERLEPALHPGLHDRAIDLGALGYAVARLPENVTKTTFLYLCSSLPELYRRVALDPVATAARRRAIWSMMPGKLLVLLRDGVTDRIDLLTCLCAYAFEARKIRRRLRDEQTFARLDDAAQRWAAGDPDPLAALPFSDDERAGLAQIWATDPVTAIRDIVVHHEDFGIECDLVSTDYNTRASEAWVAQLREAAGRLVDLDAAELQVHIISSNTHSVANCLSPYLGENAERIVAWGRRHMAEVEGELALDRDRLYVWARGWERAHPEARGRRMDRERAGGHIRLTEAALTGIAVDLIDLGRLEPAHCDPAVAAVAKPNALLVNVDYAFGQQAEEILANLAFLFGRRIRSLNVLGKAGALVGERGDILLPTDLILQTNDEVYALDQGLAPAAFAAVGSARPVHYGRVLTVAGTLLQDPRLLRFYRRMFGCIGLEMEGSYFARQTQTLKTMGVVAPDIVTRYAYYTSDLPLAVGHNLSASLAPHEGVPPLYAITRAMLRGVFAGEARVEKPRAGGAC
ncbi:MAG: cyclic nucleotide-binding domain-containing protein [Myxococcota bacterium]